MRKWDGTSIRKEVEMESRSILDYFRFGTCLRFLQDAPPVVEIHGKGNILMNIDRFLNHIRNLTLPVTSRVLKPLVSFKEKLSKIEENRTLTKDETMKLNELIFDIRKTLEAELEGIESFSITPKIIDVNKLIDDVPSLFAPDIFGALPEIARYDFTEAGKCIAFERPTATAFHILRGTEAFLKHFYLSFIKQKKIKELMWGPIVENLRIRPKTKKHETLYNNLDNIRHSYRNPTQHPEMIYDIHLVQDLWGLCIEAINRMGRILKAAGL